MENCSARNVLSLERHQHDCGMKQGSTSDDLRPGSAQLLGPLLYTAADVTWWAGGKMAAGLHGVAVRRKRVAPWIPANASIPSREYYPVRQTFLFATSWRKPVCAVADPNRDRQTPGTRAGGPGRLISTGVILLLNADGSVPVRRKGL